jgi:uncharacterized protein (TIGR00297 family)
LTPIQSTDLLVAGLLAGGFALFAALLRLLTFSGALAAFIVGFLIFAFGGVPFAVPLLAFFLSSSLLSRVGRVRKAHLDDLVDKGHTRDAGQVLANGAVAATFAFLSWASPNSRNYLLLYLAALAAVNADTWATEIGTLWRGKPVSLATLRRTEPGMSGAVSLMGLVAALFGAVFIVLVGRLAWPAASLRFFLPVDLPEGLAIAWAGFTAAFADSVLGASVQAQYRCPRCGAVTEKRLHCDVPGGVTRGLPFVNNDVVNFVASGLGVLFAAILLYYFANPR